MSVAPTMYEFSARYKGQLQTFSAPSDATVADVHSSVLRVFNLFSAKVIGLTNSRLPSLDAQLHTLGLSSSHPVKLIIIGQTHQSHIVSATPLIQQPNRSHRMSNVSADIWTSMNLPVGALPHLWLMMSNVDVLNAIKCNRSSHATLTSYPICAMATLDNLKVYVNVRPQITNLMIDELQTLQYPRLQRELLTRLTFGRHFNQSLAVGVLPLNLTHLTFSDDFNQRIDEGVLPVSLIHLTFGHNFNKPLPVLPPSLAYLVLGDDFSQPLIIGTLPSSLIHLTVGFRFNRLIRVGVLPSSLTHLTFGVHFNQPLRTGVLPSTVTQLCFEGDFNQPLEIDALPSSLTHLSFGYRFDQPLAVGVFPSSLTQLTFGLQFNRRIAVGVLPSSLTHLTFGSSFNQPMAVGVLPASLTYLRLGFFFDYLLYPGVIPKGCIMKKDTAIPDILCKRHR